MLQRAGAKDAGLIDSLWRAPANANWIEPPDEGEIDASISEGLAFVWQVEGSPVGFAVMMKWVPRVYGLTAFATTRPGQGAPFLRALLAQVFTELDGHRIGFDVTADNTRAIALYDQLGFVTEGRIRECWMRADGNWVDCLLMGLLARDWQA
ncbi:MAG: GNAT family protein [Paracoccaceae bacterium]